MFLRSLLSLLFVCVSFVPALAQGIRGRITNEQGKAVAFANIYVPQLSTGTSSNIEGFYKLELPKGNWKILFQYLGYQTQSLELNIAKSFLKTNVMLSVQNYQIPEIKVLASGEDPAYYIMRHAIALTPYYRNQVSKYSCKVYLKGSGLFKKIPFLLKKQMKKGGMKEGQAFVMETVSKIDFELPDVVKQKVLSMHSSGEQNSTSPMSMITNSLYDAEKYGIVSPVGKNALKVYKFSLVGVFQDQGRTINKIRVTPKIKSSDTFSGYIYIADRFWNIHSADLKLHIPMTDVQVHQLYAEVNKNTWMPVSLDFDMDFSGFGLKMNYRYVATISDYKTTLNPGLDHSFLDKLEQEQLNEQQLIEKLSTKAQGLNPKPGLKTKAQQQIDLLMKKPTLNKHETLKLNRMIETEVRRNSPPEPIEIKSNIQVSQKQVNNDSLYWAKVRPIPLTISEKKSFAKKDYFIQISARPEFQDSVRDSKRKFKLKHLLFGKTYDYSIDSIRQFNRFSIPDLTNPSSLAFNSVDGLRLDLPFSYYRSDSTGHLMRLNPKFDYAFARQKLDATFLFEYRLNGIKNSWVSFNVGTTTSNFNRTSGLSAMDNDFYTLFLKENYNRYYRRDFVQLSTSRDLVNGLNLSILVDYSENSPLTNHSNYSFIKYKDKQIHPNIPENNTLEPWQLENHRSLISRLILEYTPRHRYSIRNNTKVYADSKFPTFTLVYQGAYSGIFRSGSRYDLLKFGLRQRINFGIDDHISYKINAGKFLNSLRVYFEEFQHFDVKSTGFMFSPYQNSFRLLPFYAYSTRKAFLEAHANWQTRRLILKQLPILRNSSMLSENLFINFLTTPELKNYVETGYGISNLFMLLNVEAVAGFENGKFRSAGIKLSLNLK